jgi:hypothetical protein
MTWEKVAKERPKRLIIARGGANCTEDFHHRLLLFTRQRIAASSPPKAKGPKRHGSVAKYRGYESPAARRGFFDADAARGLRYIAGREATKKTSVTND